MGRGAWVPRLTRTLALVAGLIPLCGAVGSARLAEPAGALCAVPIRDGRAALEVRAMTATVTIDPSFAGAFAGAAERNELAAAVRLIPRSKPLDDEAAVLARVREHVGRYGCLPALAKAIELKPAHLELLLSEPAKFAPGSRASLLRDAAAWCAADARERESQRADYVPTAVTRLMVELAAIARATHTVGLVTGSPGLGKTAALQAVAAELPGRTLIVRADPRSRGARGILAAIGGAAVASNGRPAEPSIKAGIVAARRSNGLVCLDEAHLLSVSGLEAIRAVFDQSECGVVLIGTRGLRRTLGGDGDPLVGPLISRIALRLDLDAELLTPGPDGEIGRWIDGDGVRAIVGRSVPVKPDAAALAKLVELANFHDGHLRTAVNAARVAACIAQRQSGGELAALTAGHIGVALQLAGENL
jgi:hypothetical protein